MMTECWCHRCAVAVTVWQSLAKVFYKTVKKKKEMKKQLVCFWLLFFHNTSSVWQAGKHNQYLNIQFIRIGLDALEEWLINFKSWLFKTKKKVLKVFLKLWCCKVASFLSAYCSFMAKLCHLSVNTTQTVASCSSSAVVACSQKTHSHVPLSLNLSSFNYMN